MRDIAGWGRRMERATLETIERMKAAGMPPDVGGSLLARIIADIASQIETGLPGFRKQVLAALAADEQATPPRKGFPYDRF